MILDTDLLLEAVIKAQKQSGEKSLSVRMDVFVMEHGCNPPTHEVRFGSYTANTGHTKNYLNPSDAIADTLRACSDPQKLRDKAAMLQEEARQLLARVGGEK